MMILNLDVGFHRFARTVCAAAWLALLFPPAAPAGDTTAPLVDASIRDSTGPFAQRVDSLISRMTLAEKIGQVSYEAPAIPRLGVAAFDYWNESLHGITAMRSFEKGYATVFPQCIGLAATWDTALIQRVGEVISTEARAKSGGHGATFFCPNVNIFRDPRWGRGQETYGEDPLLTSRLAVSFIRGFQGADPKYLRNAAIVKHFAVHSGPETGRFGFDAFPDDRDLNETYFPAFKACVQEGKVAGVMSAYNGINGVPCSANPWLLNIVLRERWGFDGLVVSDAFAPMNMVSAQKFLETPEAVSAAMLAAGCDLPIGSGNLTAAISSGLTSEEMVDRALRRIFLIRFRLGEFDPPAGNPFRQIDPADVDTADHRALARQCARESIVLLKNDRGILPLKTDLNRIAVIGPNGDVTLFGGYGGRPSAAVSPYEGILSQVGAKTTVECVPGCGLSQELSSLKPLLPSFFIPTGGKPGRHGLHAEYFNNDLLDGPPALVRIDRQVDLKWSGDASPARIAEPYESVRWTGKLIVPETSHYNLALSVTGGARLSIDGHTLIDEYDQRSARISSCGVHLTGGQLYDFKLEYCTLHDDGRIRLCAWGSAWTDATINNAAAAARAADVVVLCVGTNPDYESEGQDRADLNMPGEQVELVENVLKVGKPTVMVLLNGAAIALPSTDARLGAVIEAWYPGEEGGDAIADVLFGRYNPSGRLPVTFYQSAAQLPPFDDYQMKGRTYRFFTGDVLYHFGDGLSYSTFTENLLEVVPAITRGGEDVHVKVKVKNEGPMDGDDVVQLYLSHLASKVRTPIRELQEFQRVPLKVGESREVEFTLKPEQLAILDRDQHRVLEPGEISVQLGQNQTQGLRRSLRVEANSGDSGR